jgi:hypothetical protein
LSRLRGGLPILGQQNNDIPEYDIRQIKYLQMSTFLFRQSNCRKDCRLPHPEGLGGTLLVPYPQCLSTILNERSADFNAFGIWLSVQFWTNRMVTSIKWK